MFRSRIKTGLLFFAVVFALPVLGQDRCSQAEAEALNSSYEYALIVLNTFRCLDKDSQTNNPLVIAFNRLTPDVEENADQRIRNVVEAHVLLIDHANNMSGSAAAFRDYWTTIALKLTEQLLGIENAASLSDPNDAEQLAREIVSPDKWELNRNTGAVLALPGRSVFTGIGAHCPRLRLDCAAYIERKSMVTFVLLADDLTNYLDRGLLLRHLKEAEIAKQQWDIYFNEARFQWWWEVWNNGRRMMNNGGCDENDKTQMREGFCRVPTNQVILFHPDIALHYVRGADTSEELKPSFFIELIGQNSWNWASDGTMQNARGWSIIATYTHLNSGKDWGYGLMYHYRNRYSIGLTSTDGNAGLILSLDLSDKFFERKTKYKSYLENLRKPSFWREVFMTN